MKRLILASAAMALVIGLAAPAPVSAQNKSMWGMILGGALGGYGGSKFGSGKGQLAATAAGTLLGAVLGGNVGRSLDRADSVYSRGRYNSPKGYRNRRVYRQPPHWGPNNVSHPYPHRQQLAMVQPTYNGCASGLIREYQTVVTVGGKEVPAWGSVCYMADGSWRKIGSLSY